MIRSQFLRLFACFLALALLCGCAVAPAAPDGSNDANEDAAIQKFETTEQPLAPAATETGAVTREDAEALSLILRILTRAIAGDPNGYELVYQRTEPYCIWTVLELLGCSCDEAEKTDSAAVLSSDVLLSYAKAAFDGLTALPAIEPYYGVMTTYDSAKNEYSMPLLCSYDASFRIDSFEQNPDGSADAVMGLYSVDDVLKAAVRYRLVKNTSYDANDPLSFAAHVSDAAMLQNDSATWQTKTANEPIFVDLDGDGAVERVDVAVDEPAYTSDLTLTDGETVYQQHFECALTYRKAHVGDANTADGCVELYLTGDVGSDDYETYVLTLKNGALNCQMIYDEVLNAFGDGTVEVSAVVDVLGTRGGICRYRMNDDGTFSIATPYTINYGADDPWSYTYLTLQKNGFPVTNASGAQTTLDAGTELILRETDEASFVVLEARDGARYRAALNKAENEWEWFIGGEPESAWFGELPYAG